MFDKIFSFLKVYYETRSMDYKISKDKYEIMDNLLKNHQKMTVAEKMNHLNFILNFHTDSNKVEHFFNTYKDPIEAIKLYRKFTTC